jgi:hypothetical protein
VLDRKECGEFLGHLPPGSNPMPCGESTLYLLETQGSSYWDPIPFATLNIRGIGPCQRFQSRSAGSFVGSSNGKFIPFGIKTLTRSNLQIAPFYTNSTIL